MRGWSREGLLDGRGGGEKLGLFEVSHCRYQQRKPPRAAIYCTANVPACFLIPQDAHICVTACACVTSCRVHKQFSSTLGSGSVCLLYFSSQLVMSSSSLRSLSMPIFEVKVRRRLPRHRGRIPFTLKQSVTLSESPFIHIA